MKNFLSLILSGAMALSVCTAATMMPELPTETMTASAAEVIYCGSCGEEIPEGGGHHTPLGLIICDSCDSAGAGGTTTSIMTTSAAFDPTITTTASDAYNPTVTDVVLPEIPEYYLDLEVGDYLEFTADLIALDYDTFGTACTYENGLLTAVEEGTFDILFYNEDGSVYAYYYFYVTDPNLPANTAPYIEEGCVYTVPVRALAGSTTVTVTCDNEDVAVVDDIEYLDELVNIHILGVSEGTATLTVEDESGYYAEIYVTVYVPEDVTTEIVTGTTLAPQDYCDSCGEFVPEGEGVRSPLGLFLCKTCSALGIGGTTTSYHTTHPDGMGTTTTNHAEGTGTTTTTTTTVTTLACSTCTTWTGTTYITTNTGEYAETASYVSEVYLSVGEAYYIGSYFMDFFVTVEGDSCAVDGNTVTALSEGTAIVRFGSAASFTFHVVPDDGSEQLTGDVNNDDILNVSDIVFIARLIAQDERLSISARSINCADYNCDENLDANDLTTLAILLVGMSS